MDHIYFEGFAFRWTDTEGDTALPRRKYGSHTFKKEDSKVKKIYIKCGYCGTSVPKARECAFCHRKL